ncbi:MAG TPA: 5-oxoprolinase subunit PxpA [Candidatus Macondimonas sp.]|nr:5-oxoprolinase subunit PxpA [Candidatus Macondimonas sp.]
MNTLHSLIRIDLNADVGEGSPADAALIPLVSSVNIACGAHAGDATTMARTVALAAAHGVAIGAHPGYADPEHFGRRALDLPAPAIHRLVAEQAEALAAHAHAAGTRLTHVKPHGALYNQAAGDMNLAMTVARAVHDVDANLTLVGLAGSALIAAGRRLALRVAAEAFVDRRYEADGSLTPRGHPDGLIIDAEDAARQVLTLLHTGRLMTRTGQMIALTANTFCVHGDSPAALALVRNLRERLAAAGIAVRPFATPAIH